jgi:RNA polymerase sigma-70 factor (ECF subfamily)
VQDAVAPADRDDLAASLAGDEFAYARLMARYQAAVARQMLRFSRDRVIVEELVQEVFVQAYLSLGKFRGSAPFEHWLRRIATHTGYAYWKRQARERARAEALAALPPPPPPEAPPSDAGEYVQGLLARLPPADRLVLTLLYLEECDTAEIAARTGWSRTLVKVRAFRARKKLRLMMEETGDA